MLTVAETAKAPTVRAHDSRRFCAHGHPKEDAGGAGGYPARG